MITPAPSLASAVLICWLVCGFVQSQSTANCPLLGPVLPASSKPSASTAVKSARAQFPGILEAALATGLPDNLTTSFSINVFSGFDDESLFNFHYSAPGLNGSLPSGKLDNDTIYRIGSLSKLLTVYTFLDQAGFASLQDPITRWVPELAAAATNTTCKPVGDEVDQTTWSDITIDALMSHMAGLPRDCKLNPAVSYSFSHWLTRPDAFLDLANGDDPLASLGFPNLTASEVPSCGLAVGLPLCSRTG